MCAVSFFASNRILHADFRALLPFWAISIFGVCVSISVVPCMAWNSRTVPMIAQGFVKTVDNWDSLSRTEPSDHIKLMRADHSTDTEH